MKKKIIITILFTALSIFSVFSQHLNTAKLDSLFNMLDAKNKAMGSAAIMKNGKLLYQRAIGYSYISENSNIEATTNTKYRIGSITKMFTATMVFQLIEEGKITLNTTLNNYFPDLPNARKITIGDLLDHRSGLHNITSEPDFKTWRTTPKTEGEMLSIIASEKPDFQPNEKAAYSNTNYLVLGYIIEKITHKSYAENLKERITSRIGLQDTYCGNKTNIAGNESFSYQYIKKWEQMAETDMSIPGGAGCIVSTPADLVKFIDALFSRKLVSQQSLAKMTTIRDGFGMGLAQFSFDGNMAYGHGGAIDGFISLLDYFPEDSMAIAYCSNGQIYSLEKLVFGILDICYNKPYLVPSFYEITDPKDLNGYLGVYTCTQNSSRINVSKDSTTLVVQTDQDSPLPVDAVAKDKFSYNRGSIKLDFNTAQNELTVTIGEKVYLYKKDLNFVPDISDNNVFGNRDEKINNFTGYIYYLPRHSQRLPDFTGMKPVGKLYANYLNVPVQDYRNGFPGISDRIEDYAIDYKGKFYVKENSDYCFMVGSDDGTKVFIDGRLLINNDFVHPMEYQLGCTKLKMGLHSIEVQYFQGPGGGIGLVLRYKKMEDKLYQVFDLSTFFPITVNNSDTTIDISIGDELLFEFNSYKLSEVSKQTLGEIKRVIIDKTPVKSILIKGYTDDIGSETYNMKLSQQRADAVMSYLTSLGVPEGTMVAKGFGETHPKIPNVDDKSRKQNRRVEISIVKLN